MFGVVKRLGLILELPTTTKKLPQHGVIRFFDALWTDMPSGEVVLDDVDEALEGVCGLFGLEEQIGVRHEIRDAFQHAPGFQDKGGQRDAMKVHAYKKWRGRVSKGSGSRKRELKQELPLLSCAMIPRRMLRGPSSKTSVSGPSSPATGTSAVAGTLVEAIFVLFPGVVCF